MFWAILVLGAIVICATTILVGRRRFWWFWAPTAIAVASAWCLAVLAYRNDFHDADGAFDCSPDCATLQHAVAGAFVVGTPVLAYLILAVLARFTSTHKDAARRRRRVP
jgi:hypothetical protein